MLHRKPKQLVIQFTHLVQGHDVSPRRFDSDALTDLKERRDWRDEILGARIETRECEVVDLEAEFWGDEEEVATSRRSFVLVVGEKGAGSSEEAVDGCWFGCIVSMVRHVAGAGSSGKFRFHRHVYDFL